jgi:hypothetical protein
VEARIIQSAEWRALGVKLKKAINGKEVRRALTKGIQAEVRPAVADVKRAVKAINVRGVKGHGTRRRERSYAVRYPKGRLKTGSFGLRSSVARTIKSRVKYSGNTVGVRVYSDPSAMPNKQRRLPYHLNNPKGWRHPTWGNRDRWVKQYGEPYFDVTLARHTPRIRGSAVSHVDEALRELQ